MPWRRFFAGRRDLLRFLELALGEPGLEVIETYSEVGKDIRRFSDLAALQALPMIGFDWHGTGAAVQLSLWARSVSGAPRVSRIELGPGAIPGATFRYTVEGPGLFWLKCGGRNKDAVVASAFGWFTESEARRKYAGPVPLDSVDWRAHTRLARRLGAYLERDLAVEHVQGRPALTEAMELHRAGLQLKA